jgi:hypothetical protein
VLRDASGSELEDIRDTSDNTSAANQIFSLIRAWTSREDEVLFCSVAGGRKTLGIYLAMALMLCGRPEDSLSHVLVHPELESSVTDFFYPPPEATSFERSGGIAHSSGQTSVPEPFEAAKVELAEIPFPRLREALGGGLPLEKGLLEAVRHSQLVLAYLQDPPTLRLTLENGLVEVGRFSYHLTRQLLAVYAFFLHEFNGPQAAGTIEAVYERRSALAELERRIDRLRLGEREVYAWEKMRDTGELRAQLGPCISKVNRAITSALGDNTLAARYRISTGSRYGVHIERFEIRDSAGKKQPAGGR